MQLEPIEPEIAVELFLNEREMDVSETTLRHDKMQLRFFQQWCEKEEIENLNILDGRMIQQHQIWRRDEHDLVPQSLKNHMDTIRCSSVGSGRSMGGSRPLIQGQVTEDPERAGSSGCND
jgi:site-specific recombinase XerC